MVTKLKIGRGVRCINLPPLAKEKIEKDLCFDNPAYLAAMEHGQFISADMPAELHLFDQEGNDYWIPRGYIYYLNRWLHQNKYPVKILDHTLLLKPLNLKFHGTLRDYQEAAKTDIISYPIGVIEAATRSGKTVIGIAVIAHRKQPTLVIVHSKELLYQWQSEIKTFLHYRCGLLGDGNKHIKPITVGIINSVNNNLDLLRNQFGQVITDECHRCAASIWADTLQDFPAKHYLGLTATAFRRDGLGFAIFASIGPLRHKVDKKMLLRTKAVLRPKIIRIRTNFRYTFANDYSTMIKELTLDNARNELIINKVYADLKRYNENIVVVSDRKKHCQTLQELLLNKYNIEGHILTGNVTSNKRQEVVSLVKNGTCKVLFATLSLIGEGFNAPNLTVLFLVTPIKFSGRLIQGCGRVLTPPKDKKVHKLPRIYDFRDHRIPVLAYSGYSRDRVYKKEWGN